jgi:outer membrane lipoprotein SlyB
LLDTSKCKEDGMETRADKTTNPILVIAATAVVVFSAVGIAAFMGWIPTSTSGTSDSAKVATVQQAAKPAAKPQPAPARVAAAAPAKRKCPECAVVESVREIETAGQATGLGAVGGAVVGGVVGHQVGGGRGKDLATVVGAVGGAVAGNQIEKKAKSTKTYEITIRMEDGTTRVVSEPNPPVWKPGEKVKFISGKLQSNA